MICLEVFRPDEIKHSLEEKETNEEPFHISMQNLKKMFKHAKFKGKQFGMKLEKQADKRISKPVLVGRGHKDEFQEVASDSDGQGMSRIASPLKLKSQRETTMFTRTNVAKFEEQ